MPKGAQPLRAVPEEQGHGNDAAGRSLQARRDTAQAVSGLGGSEEDLHHAAVAEVLIFLFSEQSGQIRILGGPA